jgi:hypothetical protein
MSSSPCPCSVEVQASLSIFVTAKSTHAIILCRWPAGHQAHQPDDCGIHIHQQYVLWMLWRGRSRCRLGRRSFGRQLQLCGKCGDVWRRLLCAQQHKCHCQQLIPGHEHDSVSSNFIKHQRLNFLHSRCVMLLALPPARSNPLNLPAIGTRSHCEVALMSPPQPLFLANLKHCL